jgi:L-malate glycosyltransferase
LPNSELIKKYSESDIYINLSRIESFGITFVEALASQIPIISFDTKGVNEIIIDKYNGYIIRENNINYMSNIIIEIYNNPSLLNSLEEGIINSCKEYDLNLVTNKFIDAYNNLKQQ